MFIFMQKSMIGAIVKIVQLELTADHMKKYQAIWSRSVDDEQLALLMSDGIQFVCPSPQQSSESFPRVMVTYSCITWSPSSKGKSKTLLAARQNFIDAVDVATGKIIASFGKVIEPHGEGLCKSIDSQDFWFDISLPFRMVKSSHSH